MFRKRPLWFYGLLCLIASVLPQMLFPAPQDPRDASGRFFAMMLFSVIGLTLIVLSAIQNWRTRK